MPKEESIFRCHWLLKMLLKGNLVISILWSISYLYHLLFRVKPLSFTLLFCFLVAFGAELLRIYSGNSINLCSNKSTYWMIFMVMPCVEMPAMVCLRWSLGADGAWMHNLWNSQFLMINLQSIASLVYHLRSHAN